MAGAPKVRSLNIASPETEARPVLVPGGNKARYGPADARKPSLKPVRKAETGTPEKAVAAGAKKEDSAKRNAAGESGGGSGGAAKGASPLPSPRRTPPGKAVSAGAKDSGTKMNSAVEGGGGSAKSPSPLPSPRHTPSGQPRRNTELLRQPSLSLNVSCPSDASTESIRVRASSGTGRVERSRSGRPAASKHGKATVKADGAEVVAPGTPVIAQLEGKRRCAWVTTTTDSSYVAFHDGEWGVPVHDDRTLFELLVLSGALAELTWPEILKRRQTFREIFMDFEPTAVSKINEKKVWAPGSISSSLLSEQKLRAVLENARQIVKIADEFGSFNRYCWGFLNHKPIVNQFRHAKQVPVKSPKADIISKDMLRRGFRGVGPTVIYSFMQAAGLTNDHLVSCFRFKECNANPTPCASDAERVDVKADLKKDEITNKVMLR